jgi:hypothetical protein
LVSISFKLPDFSSSVEPIPDIVVKARLQSAPVAQPKTAPLSIEQLFNEALAADQQQQAMESKDDSKGQAFILPPSAKISYQGFINGGQVGIGEIDWQTKNKDYQLEVSVPVPFLGQFTFTSVGKIDAFGMAPDFYQEVRGSRGTRSVNFIRDQKLVIFSMNQESSAIPSGTQDRFSVMFQLAALVAGNPSVDQQGVARDIPIASIDKLETWTFVSLGDEELQMPIATYQQVRHFLRLPRDKDDKRRFEVWLAKDANYLPVIIKQTEVSGTTYELQMNQLTLY